MADVNGKVPPTFGGAQPLQVQVPAIELGNVSLAVGPVPNRPELKQLIIGPIMLTLPLNDAARRTVVEGLTGVQIAGATPPAPPQ